jgi:hypothetical protein
MAVGVGPDGYVSAAAIGATIGWVLPGIGVVAGALIGGVVDIFLSARQKKKARKRMKKAFMLQLLKRFNSYVFVSALERLGMAMMYIQALGLKPGTPDFDKMLKKKTFPEIGYKGDCAIDLLGPAPEGQQRPVLASIDKTGYIQPYSQHIDLSVGKKWAEACKELHKAALKAWAAEQSENIIFKRELQAEKDASRRRAATRIMVNTGLIMLMLGYTIMQKKKVKKIRQVLGRTKEQRKQKMIEKKRQQFLAKQKAEAAAKKKKEAVKKVIKKEETEVK